ncbi:MAG: hypothetical protein OXG44_21910, partial [Gammaproteobacteria bacterium]|nr:hypothetical protein [Gammaproteobacteria bacterium]
QCHLPFASPAVDVLSIPAQIDRIAADPGPVAVELACFYSVVCQGQSVQDTRLASAVCTI